MSTPASIAFQALKEHLKTITVANGYRQNVNVDSGQPETDATNDDNLPMLMLLSLDERFANNDDTEIHPWSPMQFWQRRVLLFGEVSGKDDWETKRDDLLDDTRRALARYKKPLTVEPPTFEPPSEGNNVASFSMFVWFDYVLDYTDISPP